MKTSYLALTGLAFLLATTGCDVPNQRRDAGGLAEEQVVADALAPAIVRVEFSLKFDNGEPPYSGDRLFREERTSEVTGFLVTPTQVVTIDRVDYPRFIESVAVRQGDELVKARVASFAVDHQACFLELEKPFTHGKPLEFDAKKGPPYLSVSCGEWSGSWTTQVQRFSQMLLVTETGRKRSVAPVLALITDAKGTPVGLSMDGEFPPDDSWKGSPLAWATCSGEERDKLLGSLRQWSQAVVRTTLHFRSPSKETGPRRYTRGDDDGVTELDVPAVVMEGGRILVLATLRPKTTARLETITVHLGGNKIVAAKFEGTLRDYGALVAKLEQPLPAAALSEKAVFDYENVMLPAADIRLFGDNRTVYFCHRRIMSYTLGWHRQILPQVYGNTNSLFLFDTAGALVALPLAHREKVVFSDTASSTRPQMVFASYLHDVLDHLSANLDPANVPLTEQQEHRLAWLGAELQPLNAELARANKVSEMTSDGSTGALVAYVYPNSPAAKAGIEPGSILLRLRIEGQPRPLEVRVDSGDFSEREFPWEALDRVSEEAFDRIPTPWTSTETRLTRTLTDVGFGTKFTVEFVHEGRVMTKDMVVAESPTNYDAAPRFKATALGLTVRDMTYEVRRTLQKKDSDPGVVISKIESGSKASVSGLRPFELITNVNDKPVMNVKEFEAAVAAAKDEVRLSVRRMNNGRVVKIQLSDEQPKEAVESDEPPPAAKKPAVEKPAVEKPAVEKPTAEKPATGEAAKETPKAGSGNAGTGR
jgi:serine protease Do